MKTLWLLLSFILCPLSFSWGAAVVDTTSTSASNVTVATFSHTITGANTLLLCTVIGTNNRTITSYTYDGAAMTVVNREDNAASGPALYVAIYRLATGTGSGTPKNAEVTLSAIEAVVATCTSFTGVDQTTPTGTSAKNNNSGTSVSTTITIPASGLGYDAGAMELDLGCGDQAPGGSQTQLYDTCDIDDSSQAFGSTIAATGSQAMTWTLSESHFWAHVAVPINAVPVVTTRRRVVVVQ